MNRLSARIVQLETALAGASLTIRDAIDRPPQETREQWLARKAGNPTPGLVNSKGETHEQWVTRRHRELELMLCKDNSP
jgi:hypothetical protein